MEEEDAVVEGPLVCAEVDKDAVVVLPELEIVCTVDTSVVDVEVETDFVAVEVTCEVATRLVLVTE